MKAYSVGYNVVKFAFETLKNAQVMMLWMVIGKKTWQELKYLIDHFWEAIQTIWVKFLWDTYDHLGYPHTTFHPILRGSCAKPWWTDMELPLTTVTISYIAEPCIVDHKFTFQGLHFKFPNLCMCIKGLSCSY